MKAIDLNADLAEGVTDDAALIEVVTSANVACGYHAGDTLVMAKACELAAARGVTVGAQVSYADREGFGRRPLDVSFEVLRDQVEDQVSTLSRVAARAGTAVRYVKPHGALYSRVVDDDEQARAVLEGSGELPVLGLPGSALLRLARGAGRASYREGFPDRHYTPQGRLVPRGRADALVESPEEVARRAVAMAHGGEVDSVCLHGDSPDAVAVAHLVRRRLEADGLALRAF